MTLPGRPVPDAETDIVNKLLTLYVVDRIDEQRGYLNDVKALKVLFDGEYDLVSSAVRALNFAYYRWHYGPFSGDVYSLRDEMRATGLLTETWRPTQRGHAILRDVEDLLDENARIMTVLDEKADAWAHVRWQDVKDTFYARRVRTAEHPDVERPIRDIPLGEWMLLPLPKERARHAFVLDEGWRETLDLHFAPDVHDRVREAFENAGREGAADLEL